MNRIQPTLQPTAAPSAAQIDPFPDLAQLSHWRALTTQKVQRKAALIQRHYREQRVHQSLSAAHHEQLFHIIELAFFQLEDWQVVIDCVLSADATMQRQATLARWGTMLKLAIQAARYLANGAAEAALTRCLGLLRQRQGQLHAAMTCLADAEALLVRHGLTTQLPKLWCQQAELWISQGNYRAAQACLTRSEGQAGSFVSPDEQIALYSTWGLLAYAQGDPQAAIAWYEKALAVTSSASSPARAALHQDRSLLETNPHLGLAHGRLGSIHISSGDYEAALIHLTAAQQCAAAIGDDETLGRMLSLIGMVWGLRGHLYHSIDFFQQAATLAERCGFWPLAMAAHSNVAVSHYRLGELTQALRAVQRALHWSKWLEHPSVHLNSLVNKCEILCALAQALDAQAVLSEADSLLATLEHTPHLVAIVTGARARLAVLTGDRTAAIDHFLAAIDLMQATENRFEAAEFAIELVPLYLAQHDWAAATRWIAVVETTGHELPQQELIGQAARLAGDLARFQGDLPAARRAYQAAQAAFAAEDSDRNRYLATQLAACVAALL